MIANKEDGVKPATQPSREGMSFDAVTLGLPSNLVEGESNYSGSMHADEIFRQYHPLPRTCL